MFSFLEQVKPSAQVVTAPLSEAEGDEMLTKMGPDNEPEGFFRDFSAGGWDVSLALGAAGY